MRNTLILIAIATAISGGTLSAGGWSHKQGQDTVKGGVFGAVVGGVVGHQSGNQKEGILIGTVLGSIVGNKIGKGRDERHEQQRQEQIAREQAHQRELQRREQERMRSRQVVHTDPNSPVHGGRVGTDYTYMSHEEKQLLAARLRAEKAERELHAELERQRIIEERQRALNEYRERERQARERLLRAKGYTPESHPNLFY